MRASVLLLALALPGCATFPQCSVGVMAFGPIPVPVASCEVILAPEDAEDEDEDDEDEGAEDGEEIHV